MQTSLDLPGAVLSEFKMPWLIIRRRPDNSAIIVVVSCMMPKRVSIEN